MTGGTELDVVTIELDWYNEGNQWYSYYMWYSYDMTGGNELYAVTINGLMKVTSDTVITWREELS